MTKESKKLKWQRVDDSFDLKLVNPDSANTDVLKSLLNIVEKTKSWGRHFCKDASTEFNRWLQNLSTPLKAQAYARLSNWFLCDKEFIRRTDLARASKNFWNALFCVSPEKRLTDPKKDHVILSEEFVLWWPKQSRCQEDC